MDSKVAFIDHVILMKKSMKSELERHAILKNSKLLLKFLRKCREAIAEKKIKVAENVKNNLEIKEDLKQRRGSVKPDSLEKNKRG